MASHWQTRPSNCPTLAAAREPRQKKTARSRSIPPRGSTQHCYARLIESRYVLDEDDVDRDALVLYFEDVGELTCRVGAQVCGVVIDSRGRPVRDHIVELTYDRVLRRVRSGADGKFAFRGLNHYLRGVRVQVRGPFGQSRSRPLDPWIDERPDLVLKLEATGIIEGIVRDPAGNAVPGARVVDLAALFAGESAPVVITDRRGRYRLPAARPGIHSLVALLHERWQRHDIRQATPVELAPGEHITRHLAIR